MSAMVVARAMHSYVQNVMEALGKSGSWRRWFLIWQEWRADGSQMGGAALWRWMATCGQ